MIKYLTDYNCINVERILLLKGKECGLEDEEIYVMMLIDVLSSLNTHIVSPQLLLHYSSMTASQLDQILQSLLKKHWIINKNGSVCFNNALERLLENKEPEMADYSLIEIFEEQFGRALSPMEVEIIKEWITSGHSEETIIMALKEAVKSQVLTCRYIGGILENWKQNGVKTRYIQDKPKERTIEPSYYKWWEDE